MFNHASSSKTSNWSSRLWPAGLVLSGLVLMGQSCSINIGSGGKALDGGIFRSDDHGQTWRSKNFVRQDKKKTVTISNLTTLDLVFHPRDPETMYIGSRENGIWLTTNAGEQWQVTSLRAGAYQCLDFDPNNPDIMYTASGTFAFKSIDGGLTWQTTYTESQPGQTVTCVVVDPNRGSNIWLFTSGGKIVRSDDYGQTWTLKQTVPAFSPRLIVIDPNSSGRMTVFTKTQGIFVIENDGLTSRDLSPALVPFQGALTINAVAMHGSMSRWWVATNAGLLISTDRGETWTMVQTLVVPGSTAVTNVAVNPEDVADIFITTGQKLHHSTDGGLTWTVTILPTGRLPVWLTFSPNESDRLFFGTFLVPKKK